MSPLTLSVLMQRSLLRRPEDTEFCVTPPVYESRSLPIWDTFDIWICRQQFPSGVITQCQPAPAHKNHATLFAIQALQDSMGISGVLTEDSTV
jgi:hypothetical protein